MFKMCNFNFMKYLIICLINVFLVKAFDWSYKYEKLWSQNYSLCDCKFQSPITLNFREINTFNYSSQIQKLIFRFYDKILAPFVLRNNGYTIIAEDIKTEGGFTPYITGGLLGKYIYTVAGFQFHWGSRFSKGSEHRINGKKYDAELQILHKIQIFKTLKEASQRTGTIAILAIMLQSGEELGKSRYPVFNTIFEALPKLKYPNSTVTIEKPFNLIQLLGNIEPNQFYTYYGSLTSPPCSEAVVWHVYPEPLTLPNNQLSSFFDLIDSHLKPLIRNARSLKPRNSRSVYFRHAIG